MRSDKWTDRRKEKKADRQTDRQTGRQAGRRTDRTKLILVVVFCKFANWLKNDVTRGGLGRKS